MQDTNLGDLGITGVLTTFEYCLSSEKGIDQFKTTTYFFRMCMHLNGSLCGVSTKRPTRKKANSK